MILIQLQMKNNIAGLFFVLMSIVGYGQHYSGTISKVEQDGLHLVLLQPEVRSVINSNTAFFRILDKNKKEISYADYTPVDESKLDFVELPITKRQVLTDSLTSFEIENKNEVLINSLVVFVINTSISKQYNVSGSKDGQNWFGLVQNQLLHNLNNEDKKQVEKIISIPINNYKYLRIDFSDKNSLPINIEKFGVYQSGINYVSHLELNNFTTKINVKDKKTQIIVNFKSPQVISKINFDIASDLYFRKAKVVVNKIRKIKKREEKYQQEVFAFVLNSKTNNSFLVDDFFEKEFVIEIENEDNQPLEIQKISLFQTPAYVVANLKSNEVYAVKIDSTLSRPSYDLQNFQPENTSELKVLNIENFSKIIAEELPKKQPQFWQTKWFMWLSILIGVLVVSYFAFGLLKDIKNKAE